MPGTLRWNPQRRQWMVDIEIAGRRVRRLVGTDKRLAQDVLTEYQRRAILARHGMPVFVGGRSVRLRDYAVTYRERVKASNLAAGTREIRRRALELHLLPALGDLYLSALSPSRVRDYVAGRMREGASASLCRMEVQALSHLLKHAAEDGHLPARPKFTGLPQSGSRRRTLSVEQVAALLVDARRYPEYERWLRLALQTGMRLGEVLAARWRDLDLETGALVYRSPKVRRTAVSYVGAALLEDLRREPGQPDATIVPDPPTRPGGREEWIRGAFRRACVRCGVKGASPHTIRHTVVSHLLEAGVSPAVARDYVGHSSITTTDRYAHAVPDAIRQASERLPWASPATLRQRLAAAKPKA